MCACMFGYMCAGFAGAWSKPEVAHEPLACDAVEEVMRPSPEACASVGVEQMCCGIEATRDVPPCSAGVGKSVHVCE